MHYHLSFDPPHYQIDNERYLSICQSISSFYAVPLFNAAPATCAGCVLGNKYGMPLPWSLFAVILGELRTDPRRNEIKSVFPNGFNAFVLNVNQVSLVKLKLGSK